jgi:AcrR family transcriptional regulator
MGIQDTKQKILDASLQLFNDNGINNVRLQQIADETGISVGNLAYHYNNKEAITESLIANVITELQELLKQYGKYESLNDMDFFFKEFYRLCTQYRFFNFDILEIKRNFPASYELLQPLFNKVKLQLERRFELLIQQRLLQKETNSKNMAANTWLFMFFIPAEGQLNGKNATSENFYRRRLWDYITLHFTAKGSTEFGSAVEPEFAGK